MNFAFFSSLLFLIFFPSFLLVFFPSFLLVFFSSLLFYLSAFLHSGRVKLASKKNFLLSVRPDDHWLEEEFGTKPILRFGKVTKDRFALDYRYPLSAYTALGIALSAFANKLVVT